MSLIANSGTKAALLGVALLMALSACGRSTGKLSELEYRPPSGSPALPARLQVAGDERAAILGAKAELERMGLVIGMVDASNGLLTATYVGDAEAWVNCGSMRLGSDAPFQPASAARMSLRSFPDQQSWVALRQMRLDARLVARTRAGDSMTQLNAAAAYVLTRTVDTLSSSGAILGTVRETISFESGGVGRFENGTTCYPTGALERAVAGAMATASAGPLPAGGVARQENAGIPAIAQTDIPEPAAGPAVSEGPISPVGPPLLATDPVDMAAVTVSDVPAAEAMEVETPEIFASTQPCADIDLERAEGGDIRISGYVAGEAERDTLLAGIRERAEGAGVKDEILLLPPGTCEALRFMSEASAGVGASTGVGAGAGATAQNDGFAIALSELTEPLQEGAEVVLEVTIPGADRYFYVGYIQEDGTIRHLGPKYIDSRSIGDRFLYKTGYEVSAPAGIEMIIAVASREPVFNGDRPAEETAAQFFAELRSRFGRAPENVAATKLVFQTAPR